MRIGYDIDGVIIRKDGVISLEHRPENTDFIITGRSFHKAFETVITLSERMVYAPVYFNPLPSREVNPMTAAEWKARMIEVLAIEKYYEDDLSQIEVIRARCPNVEVVHVR